jgi:adenylate cyclase class 2
MGSNFSKPGRMNVVRKANIGMSKLMEIEVKFYLNTPDKFEDRLKSLGAFIVRDRCLEDNILFDNVTNTLHATRQVLRLRQDDRIVLTYKGAGEVKTGVLTRKEIEVVVSDFELTRQLLEGLGYWPRLKYQKYRTVYRFNQCDVVVDEMPYGWFCEIEGPSPQAIRAAARALDLRWETRVLDSYRTLFERCRKNRSLKFTDLTFNNFKGVTITPGDLGIIPADD